MQNVKTIDLRSQISSLVEEYKRIQQFPDDWQIEGSIINQYKQIGNAVPIGLGEALGRTILNNLQGKKINEKFRDFNYSRYKNTDDLGWKASYNEAVRKAKFEQLQLAFPK